ncbi:MAG: Arc family DNA-binding protein [Verrucomicrobiota bacterium]
MRIDPALWADLEAWAADELRSVNGQIEYVLRQAVQKRKGRVTPPLQSEPPRMEPPAKQP